MIAPVSNTWRTVYQMILQRLSLKLSLQIYFVNSVLHALHDQEMVKEKESLNSISERSASKSDSPRFDPCDRAPHRVYS